MTREEIHTALDAFLDRCDKTEKLRHSRFIVEAEEITITDEHGKRRLIRVEECDTVGYLNYPPKDK